MTNAHAADEARQGLLASVTGKAKEVAGAVLGNDSLATEGQLQQAEATARKEAGAKQAVADVRAEEAAEVLAREHAVADRQLESLEQVEQVREQQLRREAAAEQASVAVEVEREKALEQAATEQEASQRQAAADAEARAAEAEAERRRQEALREHEQQRASADAAEQAATRAREEADRLAAQAELPQS